MTLRTPGLAFYLEQSGAAQSTRQLLIKNPEQAFVLDATMALTLITDTDYPGKHTYAVTSITRVSTTATVTTTATNALSTGQTVVIAGASPADYNGSFVITVTGGTTFTYTVAGSPTTPATGTITAYGGKETVPGVAYLDGYFFVMTDEAVIYNSDLGNGASWNALDFITAEKEPGAGMALGKSQNYIIAFKEWSTEFFYDAANATGSPLSPVDNGFVLVGCASGESVASLDGNLFWISRTRQTGRSVHMMAGVQNITQISTPDIDRVLNLDDLADIYSYGIKIGGHMFYVLTLKTTGITLVYDLVSKSWSQWTSMVARASKSVTSIVDGLVTTSTAHGLSDGDPVTIAGATPSTYNGTFGAQYLTTTTFRLPVSNGTATGTITAVGYDESYFVYSKYVSCGGRDLVLHESNGHLYEVSESDYTDAGLPIDVLIRTQKFDAGNTDYKTMGKVEVIGDKVDSTALVRWSDDDYVTSSTYRPVDLDLPRSQVRRCGNFRRRSFDLRHCGNTSLQLDSLELQG